MDIANKKNKFHPSFKDVCLELDKREKSFVSGGAKGATLSEVWENHMNRDNTLMIPRA